MRAAKLVPERPEFSALRQPVPKKQGWVWPTIREVLEQADEPLTHRKIYSRAIELVEGPLSKSTIGNELRRRLDNGASELRQDPCSRYYLTEK